MNTRQKTSNKGNSFLTSAELKEKGNLQFKAGYFNASLECYRLAADLIKEDATEEQLWIRCTLNTAAAQIHIDDFFGAIESCTSALEKDSTNIKGLVRRGLSFNKVGDFNSAARDLKLAHSIDPNNKKAKEELLIAKKGIKDSEKLKTEASGCDDTADIRTSIKLPANKIEKELVRRVSENQITIISGDTGSGKSSQVPQILLRVFGGKILCTQPRRLAVVGIANRVACEMNCSLGSNVGYVIGQRRHMSTATNLVFCTAGVLFEDLRAKGVEAVAEFHMIILDECHERSIESDLVMVSLKRLLVQGAIRCKLVLMSATFDHQRYIDFFEDVNTTMHTVNIPIFGFNKGFHTQEFYLDTIVDLMKKNVIQSDKISEYEVLMKSFRVDPVASECKLPPVLFDLMIDLIEYVQATRSPEFSVLIFLPTYRSLETAHAKVGNHFRVMNDARTVLGDVRDSRRDIHVSILHSSVDVDKCLAECDSADNRVSKIILSSNIGESSITIPNCACVIDFCKSLRLNWDPDTKMMSSKMMWCSKSQAKQRKGRTGRTCDGVLFRLVPFPTYESFQNYEIPSLVASSLRNSSLKLLAAENKTMKDPRSVFSSCMDSPNEAVVEDALIYLEQVGAAKKSVEKVRKRKHSLGLSSAIYSVSTFGILLANLPLELEHSLLLVKGSRAGLLMEAVTLAVICSTTPYPIEVRIGAQNKHLSGFGDLNTKVVDKITMTLASLAAVQFHQTQFLIPSLASQYSKQTATGEATMANTYQSWQLLPGEEAWCQRHFLNADVLHHVAEGVKAVLDVLRRYPNIPHMSLLIEYFFISCDLF